MRKQTWHKSWFIAYQYWKYVQFGYDLEFKKIDKWEELPENFLEQCDKKFNKSKKKTFWQKLFW